MFDLCLTCAQVYNFIICSFRVIEVFFLFNQEIIKVMSTVSHIISKYKTYNTEDHALNVSANLQGSQLMGRSFIISGHGHSPLNMEIPENHASSSLW